MKTPERRYFRLEFRLPKYMKVLPNFFDRCEASRHFLIQATEDPEDRKAAWYARASLNEFKSAFGLIGVDIKAIGLKRDWEESAYKKELEEDLIIRMVNQCRNLSFHVAKVTPKIKERTIRIISGDESHISTLKTLFIDGMKNLAENSRLKLTPDELREVSEIEDDIPLFMILAECYRTTSVCLENFLIEHKKVDVEESRNFWEGNITPTMHISQGKNEFQRHNTN